MPYDSKALPLNFTNNLIIVCKLLVKYCFKSRRVVMRRWCFYFNSVRKKRIFKTTKPHAPWRSTYVWWNVFEKPIRLGYTYYIWR